VDVFDQSQLQVWGDGKLPSEGSTTECDRPRLTVRPTSRGAGRGLSGDRSSGFPDGVEAALQVSRLRREPEGREPSHEFGGALL
jgi:hypothetical protein